MEDKKTFPIEISIDVKWGEMDALQHVNNAVFFKYFETVRLRYFDDSNLMESLDKEGIFPILASTACKFTKPLHYPDTIKCACRISSIGNTSFVQQYQIWDGAGDVSAIGEGVIVLVSKESNSKTAIPQFVLDSFYKLQPKLKP